MASVLCRQISLLLISTASLWVDRILQTELRLTARLQSQLGIWLILAITIPRDASSEDHDDHDDQDSDTITVILEPWLHTILLANIGWICVQSQQQNQPVLSRSTIAFPVNTAYTGAMRSVAVSSWLTSIVVVIAGARGRVLNGDDYWSCQVFALAFVLVWVGQWLVDHPATIARDMHAIPSGITCYSSATPETHLDETQWYLWNTTQTWQWLTQIVKKHDEETASSALQLLRPHLLRGQSLDSLTVLVLVQALHLPYGTAVAIVREVADLAQRTPNPHSTIMAGVTASQQQQQPGLYRPLSLEVHDREYYDHEAHAHYGMNNNGRDETTIPTIPPSMDLEMEERLVQLMKERYGIELPTIRSLARPNPKEEGNSRSTTNHSSSIVDVGAPHPLAPEELVGQPDAIAPAVLEQMPERIRDIALRRPDLVHALLKKKNLLLQKEREFTSPITTTTGEEDEDEDMEDHDGEMTSLVQRRPHGKR
jgi:hypothetical protein